MRGRWTFDKNLLGIIDCPVMYESSSEVFAITQVIRYKAKLTIGSLVQFSWHFNRFGRPLASFEILTFQIQIMSKSFRAKVE